MKRENLRHIKRLLKYVDKKWLILSLVLCIPSTIGALILPVLSGKAIDQMIGAGLTDMKALISILLWILAAAGVSAAARYIVEFCNRKLTYRTVLMLRKEAFEHMQHLPLKAIDRIPSGDAVNRITTDTDQLADGLLIGFSQLFSSILTIAGTLYFMFSMNWVIALAVVILTPLSLFTASKISSATYKYFKKQTETRGKQAALIDELIKGQKVIKAYGAEKLKQEQFDTLNEQLRSESQKAVFASSLTNPATRFINSLVYACVGILGAFFVLQGRITVGELSAFLSYANQYTKPFNEISSIIAELQGALACAERVFDLMDKPVQTPDTGRKLQASHGRVDIQNVSFRYVPEVPLITDFSLNIKPGQHVAIVGPTGCGKTTLINLLMRFYDPDGGSILIDGENSREVDRASVRSTFGMVLQETWLRKGTVYENITLADEKAGREEVEAAAKAAHAHDIIMRLPNGYNTYVGEEGGLLSEGEKQLVCIARILLRKPAMLILDEATSNIDTRTEVLVQKAFDDMMRGRTSFVVAHRLSTIRNADVIIVMNHGNVVETGTHEQLLAKGGFYSKLYNAA